MTFKDSILLPSQENLLQRLQHVSLYGSQLLVVTGQTGSGKTTLITSLINELDEFSSALVLCPKHCDNSEIRRKILVQLLTEPVFDDETPLPETLLRYAGSLPQSCFIVLDDAHHLSIELIAECIVLSQLSISGKSVSLTLTTTEEFFYHIVEQLPENQQENLLSINIDPLTVQEKEALYYTLLSRSDQVPFTPREIVRTLLQKQSGTPQEVVNLLELSLHGKDKELPKRPQYRLALLLFLICSIALIGYLYLSSKVQEEHKPKPDRLVMDTVSEDYELAEYGENLLADRYRVKQALLAGGQKTINNLTLSTLGRLKTEDTQSPLMKANIVFNKVVEVEAEFSPSEMSQVDIFDGLNKIKSSELSSLDNLKYEVKHDVIQPWPKGFTLQLASVKKLESLNNILKQFHDEPDILVARNDNAWVVLIGEYANINFARVKSKQMVVKYHFEAPWIRQWKDLTNYQIQDSLPARDIP